MKRARILLADDHALTLEGIRAVVEPHHEIIGMVTDGRALLDAALRLKPDLVVLDITMPLLNGIDAAVQIKKSLPDVKLLFVTMHVNPAKTLVVIVPSSRSLVGASQFSRFHLVNVGLHEFFG